MSSTRSILIIEDEQFLSDTLRLILEKHGYAVTAAATGEDGYSFVRNKSFDLTLLDIHLKGLSGSELLKELHDCCPDMRILVVTGDVSQGAYREVMQKGADDVMYKPVSPPDLLNKISLMLS
jgi:DNA-binding response OmpR family regulator